MGALRPRSAARPRPGCTPRFQRAAPPEPGFTHGHRRAELNRTAVTPTRGRYYDSLSSLRSEGRPLSRQNRRQRGTENFSDRAPKNGVPPYQELFGEASSFSFTPTPWCGPQLVGFFKVPSRLSLWCENACALSAVGFFLAIGREGTRALRRGAVLLAVPAAVCCDGRACCALLCCAWLARARTCSVCLFM